MYLLLSRHHGSLQVGLNRTQIFRNKAPFSGKSFFCFMNNVKNRRKPEKDGAILLYRVELVMIFYKKFRNIFFINILIKGEK